MSVERRIKQAIQWALKIKNSAPDLSVFLYNIAELFLKKSLREDIFYRVYAAIKADPDIDQSFKLMFYAAASRAWYTRIRVLPEHERAPKTLDDSTVCLQANEDNLIAYWSIRGKVIEKYLPKSTVSEILTLLPIYPTLDKAEKEAIHEEITLKYGCNRIQNNPKEYLNIMHVFYLDLFQRYPFHTGLRNFIKDKKLWQKIKSENNFSLKSVHELICEATQIQLDSFVQGDDEFHHRLMREALCQVIPSVNSFSVATEAKSGNYLPIQHQLRKSGQFLDRKDRPIYLKAFLFQEQKIIISVIDFDSAQYFNRDLYLRNTLIALHDFSVNNPEYRVCLVITGKVTPELVEWIQKPIEKWHYTDLSIQNVEVLYAIYPPEKSVFFYPLRTNLHNSLRAKHRDSTLESSWQYVDFSGLLKEAIQKGNTRNFKSSFGREFLAQIVCIHSPQRDNVDTQLAMEALLLLAKDKFTIYVNILFKENWNDLEKIIKRYEIGSYTESQCREKNVQKEILDKLLIKFEEHKNLLEKNLGKMKDSAFSDSTVSLDWGHVFHDIFVKRIQYGVFSDSSQNTAFAIEALPEKLDIYSETLPFYTVKTYIIALLGEGNQKFIHIRGFSDSQSFDSELTEESRIKRKQTFWHIELEHALINILFLVMRKNFTQDQVISLSNQVFEILCRHIKIRENFCGINAILTSLEEKYITDLSTHPHIEALFSKKNATTFLNALKEALEEIKSTRPVLSDEEKEQRKSRGMHKDFENMPLKLQCMRAYQELSINKLRHIGFSLFDLFQFIENFDINNELIKIEENIEEVLNTLKITRDAYNKIIAFLESLKLILPSLNHEELGVQAKNMYIKKIYRRDVLFTKFIYVIVNNIVTLAPESIFWPGRPAGFLKKDGRTDDYYKRPTHSHLAQGHQVQAAGECIFVKNQNAWSLLFLTNGSGHYRPDAFTTLPFAENFFREALKQFHNTIDVSSLKLRNAITPNITFRESDFSPSYASLSSHYGTKYTVNNQSLPSVIYTHISFLHESSSQPTHIEQGEIIIRQRRNNRIFVYFLDSTGNIFSASRQEADVHDIAHMLPTQYEISKNTHLIAKIVSAFHLPGVARSNNDLYIVKTSKYSVICFFKPSGLISSNILAPTLTSDDLNLRK